MFVLIARRNRGEIMTMSAIAGGLVKDPWLQSGASQRLRLGSHVLDLRSRELRTDDDQLAPLRRQALQVLLVLAESPGHTVDKARLLERVWPEVVVGDDSLVQAVTDIRRILGDREQRWLRTVKRQGYMLVPDAVDGSLEDADRPRQDAPALSVAILPPAGAMAGGAAREWADRFVADLTLALGRGLTGGRIIANAAVQTYRHRVVDPLEIGADLGVRHVLASTVRADAGESHLVFVMVDAGDGQQHWTHQVLLADPAASGAAHEEAVARTARALLVHLHTAAGERAAVRSTRSAEDLAMLGWSAFYRGISAPNIEQALQWFEEAVMQDPQSLRGWGGVCVMNVDLVQLAWASDAAACCRRAFEAVQRLEQLYPDDTLTVLARAKVAQLRGDWAAALLLADSLVTRNPANPTAYLKRSQALLGLGRFDECVADTERAAMLTVDDFRAGLWLGLAAVAHFMAGRFEVAVHTARLGQAANACLPVPPLVLAAALVADGRPEEGRQVLGEQLQRSPDCDAGHVGHLLHGCDARFLEGRRRLIDCLARIGLRED
jgi:DNA-binding winged helix-turn-helix (wHTH) protein